MSDPQAAPDATTGDIRRYAIVTAAYWGFTLTDGALRMLVLLHFHTLGYTPFELALLFLLYELAGMATNLVGGWVGARFGLKLTLHLGLALQIVALALLALLDPGWSGLVAVAYVVAAQGLAGIAKDLTKMSAKSAIKLVVPGESAGLLFRWVALLTGSKNALKGVGFFLGGALLGRGRLRHGAVDHGGRAGDRAAGRAGLPLRRSWPDEAEAGICQPVRQEQRREPAVGGRGSSCSARATPGSWSACRSSSMTCWAGALRRSAVSSPFG
ncbi:hypothetical protein [Oceanibaculum nanhaiense]|uniref:hypothetical protein n=1 Tax=Oceanibaculum nanhaiense TaxID=1909734 RepID=UPI003D2B8DA3